MPGAYASLVTYGGVQGALPSIPANAATNAAAFRAAFNAGETRILVPAGSWYFEQIDYLGNPWLPPGVEVAGEGVNAGQTTMHYRPTSVATYPVAFQFAPGQSRGVLQNFFLDGPVHNGSLGSPPVPNTPPVAIGIRIDDSHFNRVRDVRLADFEVGIDLNPTGSGAYSGYNVIERFEITLCRTGIRIRDNSNGNTIQNGRIWGSLVGYNGTDPGGAREEGIGLDIEGSYLGQPIGARGLIVSGVTIETAATCLRIVSSRDIAIIGSFFEPLDPFQYPAGTYPYGRTRRRTLDIDEHTDSLTFVGSQFSAPNVPVDQENWTPTYIAIPPEARGSIDARSFPHTNTYLVNGLGAGLSGTTAAHANKIKNADFSRGAMFWSASTPNAPTIAPTTSTFVMGGASVLLTVNTSSAEHIYQDFVVDSGVRTVTLNVRYSLRSTGAHAFRFDLWDVASGTRLGFFSDVGPGPSSRWRVRSLTGRFDGLAGGVTGPRTLRVRVFPYNATGSPPQGQQVYVDSVWLVEGEYGASYRPYGEAVELLAADDREIFFSSVTNVNVGPTAAMPAEVPSNAIGMVVEVRISGSEATRYGGTITVDDQQGTNPTTTVSATFDLRITTTEITIPLTPGVSPMWTVLVGNALNFVNYRVRLKKWILRS